MSNNARTISGRYSRFLSPSSFWDLVRILTMLAVGLVFLASPTVSPAADTPTLRADTSPSLNPIRDSSFYVGLYYPGLTLGYQGENYSLELRGSSQDDIQLVGGRFSHYIYPYRGGNLYWGIDAYQVQFEDVIVEGDGYMGGLVGGLQTYLGGSLSFTIDGGPYHVKLNDDVSGVESSGLQFVVNTGINIHF